MVFEIFFENFFLDNPQLRDIFGEIFIFQLSILDFEKIRKKKKKNYFDEIARFYVIFR